MTYIHGKSTWNKQVISFHWFMPKILESDKVQNQQKKLFITFMFPIVTFHPSLFCF